MKLRFETKLEKFGGPLKNLCGPPVEKHCFRGQYFWYLVNFSFKPKNEYTHFHKTVKSVLNDHPWDPRFVVVLTGGRCSKVV